MGFQNLGCHLLYCKRSSESYPAQVSSKNLLHFLPWKGSTLFSYAVLHYWLLYLLSLGHDHGLRCLNSEGLLKAQKAMRYDSCSGTRSLDNYETIEENCYFAWNLLLIMKHSSCIVTFNRMLYLMFWVCFWLETLRPFHFKLAFNIRLSSA